jgi:hypothetical protein
VSRWHLISNVFNPRPLVLENLFVTKHPVSIKSEEKRGPSEFIDAILGQFFIESWWEFVDISYIVPFIAPIREDTESSNRE